MNDELLLSPLVGEGPGLRGCPQSLGQVRHHSSFIIHHSSFVGRRCSFRETASSQKLPVISMGNSRARGRQSETRRTFVCGPVEKEKRTSCQAVVPTVAGLTASTEPGCFVSVTRRQGPLGEVMPADRT